MRRDPKDYPNFPKSGQFRYSGFAKGYYHRWHQFLSGATDEEPPPFDVYSADPKNLEDTRAVESSYEGKGEHFFRP